MLIGVKLRGEEYDVEVTDRRDYDDPEWSWFGSRRSHVRTCGGWMMARTDNIAQYRYRSCQGRAPPPLGAGAGVFPPASPLNCRPPPPPPTTTTVTQGPALEGGSEAGIHKWELRFSNRRRDRIVPDYSSE